MTVRVTTSRICRTLVRAGLYLASAKRALRAASQSKAGRTERALKGELMPALTGESKPEPDLCDSLRLGNEAAPTGGADNGASVGYGLGGTMAELVVGGDSLLLDGDEGGDESSTLNDTSDASLAGVCTAGEPSDMALERKSV